MIISILAIWKSLPEAGLNFFSLWKNVSFWETSWIFLAKRELSLEIESIAVDYDSSNDGLDGRNTQVFKCDW